MRPHTAPYENGLDYGPEPRRTRSPTCHDDLRRSAARYHRRSAQSETPNPPGQEQQLSNGARRQGSDSNPLHTTQRPGPVSGGGRQGSNCRKRSSREHGARGWECVRDVVAGISSTGLPCHSSTNPSQRQKQPRWMVQCAPSNIAKDRPASARAPFSSRTASSADRAGSLVWRVVGAGQGEPTRPARRATPWGGRGVML